MKNPMPRYAGHDRGVVIENDGKGNFSERPMTFAELVAVEPAAKIQDDIFRHANQAGVCYYEIWKLIASAAQSAIDESYAPFSSLLKDGERLKKLVNSPEIDSFLRAVHIEAVHQVERWGTAHDRAKRNADWFWLVGYLAGKALHAANGNALRRFRHVKRGGTYELLSIGEDENNRGTEVVTYCGEDDGKVWTRPASQFFDGRFEELPSAAPKDKALHHCISTAAALYNWHCALKGTDVRMCPGRSDLAALVDDKFPETA